MKAFGSPQTIGRVIAVGGAEAHRLKLASDPLAVS